jgi:hypothetical protein
MNLEHTNCGTPECCMSCDTAVPVQLELFPVSIYTKDTNDNSTSSRLEKKEVID